VTEVEAEEMKDVNAGWKYINVATQQLSFKLQIRDRRSVFPPPKPKIIFWKSETFDYPTQTASL
jgi:hypothetical protein